MHAGRIDRQVNLARQLAEASLARADVALIYGRGFGARALERHEALLFLGAPIHSTAEGRGSRRETHDDWAQECWMNLTSGIDFDAAGRSSDDSVGCICGFCVDASLDATADGELLAVDLHWTAGPWVRLDGTVDVTADHPVMTPDGPVPAGELSAGDVVLGEDGTARALVSVERLPAGELRLGCNLRTESGVFSAGGLLFASEEPRACGP